jgi:hypothetical protein
MLAGLPRLPDRAGKQAEESSAVCVLFLCVFCHVDLFLMV